jgi:hypothetical protein
MPISNAHHCSVHSNTANMSSVLWRRATESMAKHNIRTAHCTEKSDSTCNALSVRCLYAVLCTSTQIAGGQTGLLVCVLDRRAHGWTGLLTSGEEGWLAGGRAGLLASRLACLLAGEREPAPQR